MPIDLNRFERGTPYPGDYEAALRSVQDRLASLQTAQIVHGRRALVLFEGWEGAGKKGTLKRLAAAWDPCHFTTDCVGPPKDDERERHWMARYWASLPRSGRTIVFYHGWHSRVVEQIVDDRADAKAVARACDEINEFENQQHDHGTLIVKLFFHVSADVQAERIRLRQEDPWRRWTVTGDQTRQNHAATRAAWERLFAQTDTRWAPWTVIDAGDKRAARIAALEAIASAYAKAMPAEPPVAGGTVVNFQQRLG